MGRGIDPGIGSKEPAAGFGLGGLLQRGACKHRTKDVPSLDPLFGSRGASEPGCVPDKVLRKVRRFWTEQGSGSNRFPGGDGYGCDAGRKDRAMPGSSGSVGCVLGAGQPGRWSHGFGLPNSHRRGCFPIARSRPSRGTGHLRR